MKRVPLNVIVIVLLLILYSLTYNYFISFGLKSSIYNIVFWIFMFIFSYVILGYTKNRSITKKQTIQYIFIYCMIYFILIYFLGIITGFNTLPYSHKISKMFLNMLLPLIIIVSKEFVRYMLIFKLRFSKRNIYILNFVFILVDIMMVSSMYEYNNALLIFTFIGEVVISNIYNNSLETIISYNSGVLPAIIYRAIMELYVYIVPIVPDLGVYLTTVTNVVLPVLLILGLNKLNFNYKNVSKKKVNISKMYITIPLTIILVGVASLVSGIFRYKIIAVASNSMVPIFERGDAVIYEKIDDVSNLAVGDILVFKHDDVMYIHRVVDTVYKNKKYMIYTKGDNNADNDNFITDEGDVIGVVKKEVKYIGYPTLWVSELINRE